jgi:hypothetical protein
MLTITAAPDEDVHDEALEDVEETLGYEIGYRRRRGRLF